MKVFLFALFVVSFAVAQTPKNYGCTLEYRRMHGYDSHNNCSKGFDNMYQEDFPLARKEFYCGDEFTEQKIPLHKNFDPSEFLKRIEKGKIESETHQYFRTISREHIVLKGKWIATLSVEKKNECSTDYHNLFPALQIINANRGSLDFSDQPEKMGGRVYGKHCETTYHAPPGMLNGGSNPNAEFRPRDAIKGIIGRTFLYMDSIGCYKMSVNQRIKYEKWDRKYGVTKDECEKEKKVFEYQGAHNTYTQKKCIDMFGPEYQ